MRQMVRILYDGEYFKFENDEYQRWASICDIQDWYEDLEPSCEVHSLSDIKLIIELMEDKKKAWKAYAALEEIKQKYNGENKIAKDLLKLSYECDEFALPSDLRKDIKEFLGDL